MVICVFWFSPSLPINQTLKTSLTLLCSVHIDAGLVGGVCMGVGGGWPELSKLQRQTSPSQSIACKISQRDVVQGALWF